MARKPMSDEKLKEKYQTHFFQAINEEKPLACVLIATSFIEQALMTVLSKFMVDCNTAESLFKSGNALGDLAKCADLARCLGLISEPMHKNIKLIGDLRNIFAHSPELIDFNHPSVKKPLDDLTLPKGMADYPPLAQLATTLRNKFSFVASQLYTWIQFEIYSVKRREEKDLGQVW